jgi:hypothetical protein
MRYTILSSVDYYVAVSVWMEWCPITFVMDLFCPFFRLYTTSAAIAGQYPNIVLVYHNSAPSYSF